MRAPARGWRSWWGEWKTPRRSVKCRAPSRWRVTSTVRRSVSAMDVWKGFLKCNPLPSDGLFPCQQGLSVCRGSNTTADITRRGGSCSWCHVSRRTQLNRWRTLQLLQRIWMFILSLFFFQFNFLYLLVQLSWLWFSTPGPHAAHAQVLHPPEVGVHRQALLLWCGN